MLVPIDLIQQLAALAGQVDGALGGLFSQDLRGSGGYTSCKAWTAAGVAQNWRSGTLWRERAPPTPQVALLLRANFAILRRQTSSAVRYMYFCLLCRCAWRRAHCDGPSPPKCAKDMTVAASSSCLPRITQQLELLGSRQLDVTLQVCNVAQRSFGHVADFVAH